MRRWLPHIGIALGVAIALYALFFGKSAEDRIRARLDALAQAVSVVDGETNIVIRAARLRQAFAEIFVKNVSVAIPELADHVAGRDDLVELGASAPRFYQTVRVDLGKLAVKLDQDETSAVAYGEAELTATRLDGGPESDSRTVSLRLDLIDGEWRVVDVSVSAKQQ
jgi:hypothetical protein